MDISRRDLLTTTATSGLIAAGCAAAEAIKPLLATAAGDENNATAEDEIALAAPAATKKGEMLYRTLGRTGQQVSAIGLGGFHIGKIKAEQDSIRLIRTAIDRGINFMDNSWDYHNGRSERWMGKALKNGYRQKVFLMTKLDGRTKAAAMMQIDESLKALQTDYIDLLQHHEILRFEDPDRIFASGGAMEAVIAVQKAGKVRYVGFTGHKNPLVHTQMLQVAAQNNFRFDTVQMPLNVMDAHFRSFEKQVLPTLVKNQIGVIGMKSMGDPYILRSNTVTPIECLHYSMNLPTSTVVTGIDSMEILNQAFEAVRTFKPLTPKQLTALLARTRTAAINGKYELYKTTSQFDSTAQNPAYLG
jgi:predicted aldo/keto reductase-like oxidoreductase